MPYTIDESSLSHYGVKGMKWGKRKRSGPGPVTQVRGEFKRAAVVRKVQNRDTFKALRDNDNLNFAGKSINVANRLTMGRKLTNKYYDAQIKSIDSSIDRLTTGKADLFEKMDAMMDLTTDALVVQKRAS